jgi:hypothetical protein
MKKMIDSDGSMIPIGSKLLIDACDAKLKLLQSIQDEMNKEFLADWMSDLNKSWLRFFLGKHIVTAEKMLALINDIKAAGGNKYRLHECLRANRYPVYDAVVELERHICTTLKMMAEIHETVQVTRRDFAAVFYTINF